MEPAKYLSGLRKIVDHSCIVCSNEFKALKKSRYCSLKCKQKAAYYRRKKRG